MVEGRTMKFKYNVVFGTGKEIDFYGTNRQDTRTLSTEINNPNNQIISYTLNDLPLTKKFINHWQEYRKQQVVDQGSNDLAYHYNYYKSKNHETAKHAKVEMNRVIDQINKFEKAIPESLKLITHTDIIEHDKLNELHFIFETNTINLKSTDEKYNELFALYEKVNQLVHYIERPNDNHYSNDSCLIVIRPLSHADLKHVQLVDEDYEYFTKIQNGDLALDFSTVGKDLWYCCATNDMELIKNNEVKQQQYIRDCVAMYFNKVRVPSNFNGFYEWCKQNKVDEYIDYTLPMYRPGRHVLGHIDQDINDAETILSKTPVILGAYLSYEDGTPVLPELL